MSDEATMRARLQHVAAYRQLCRSVQRGGRENIVFAVIMGVIAYFAYSVGAGDEILIFYGVLIGGELLIGLYKWAFPSAEAMILDGIILLAFAGLNFGREFLNFQAGRPISTAGVFFGFLMLALAVNRFKAYGQLRALFAERPDSEHMAWFDDLAPRDSVSDPRTDELALDLPTSPHWRAKLFGGTAFFVSVSGNDVWVAGPDDFTLVRESATAAPAADGRLRIHGESYPEFDIDDATWGNYLKWMSTQVATPPA